MNTLSRVLLGFGGVLIIIVGLSMFAGGSFLGAALATGGLYGGSSIFSTIAAVMLIIGALGCFGAFGNNLICGYIFCAILLLFWWIGTVYAAICFAAIYAGKEPPLKQTPQS